MRVFNMGDEDVASIGKIVHGLAGLYDTVESAEFQREAAIYAAELPRPVRLALHDYKYQETDAAIVLSGLKVADEFIGPTPARRPDNGAPSPTLEQDIAFYLLACLLGDPIAWATQQAGRIMHDVFPVKDHEDQQIGWGSNVTLEWHTEDAFHPLRPDYLGLTCIRNPDDVETTLAEISDVELDRELRDLLALPRFRIVPDDSHRARNAGGPGTVDPAAARLQQRSYEWVEGLARCPEQVAVLFGDPESPYLRIDPFYMQGVQGEEEKGLLDSMIAAIDRAIKGVVLHPGDICFIDNYRAVHGRKAFQARFDGTDRWLRRLNIATDLRNARSHRISPDSRVIY